MSIAALPTNHLRRRMTRDDAGAGRGEVTAKAYGQRTVGLTSLIIRSLTPASVLSQA
jgi:hypothetical protein